MRPQVVVHANLANRDGFSRLAVDAAGVAAGHGRE